MYRYYIDYFMCSSLDCRWCIKDGRTFPYKTLQSRLDYCDLIAEGGLANDGLPAGIMDPDDPNYDIVIQHIWHGWCDNCWREWEEDQKEDDLP